MKSSPSGHFPVDRPWITISLDNLVSNVALVKNRLPPDMPVMAVVKDRAYGLGAVHVARVLEDTGIEWFAVAHTGEARELRAAGITSPILVFGEAGPEDLRWGAQNRIRFALNSLESLKRWVATDATVTFHCTIDTGMTRLGLLPSAIGTLTEAVAEYGNLRMEGVFTHYASADEPGTDSVARQQTIFHEALSTLHAAGFARLLIHSFNSAAVVGFSPPQRDSLVRPGILLYGCKPDPLRDFGVKPYPVASLHAPVVRVRGIDPGTPVSYGGTWVASRHTRLATVAVGYGCGYPRALSNRGRLLIGGVAYPIVGRVTMDYTMVDIGPEGSVEIGDEAVALGPQGRECIEADEIARLCGTIGYEVLAGLSGSLDRYYFFGGRRRGVMTGTQY